MLSTYVNNNYTTPYPFYGMDELPFPMSCIIGLSICIVTGADKYKIKTPLYASNVHIDKDSIKIILNGADDKLLCSVSSSGEVELLDSRNLVSNGKPIIHAHLFIGHIPEDGYGSYTGKFIIDPSCITLMPSSVYGYHSSIETNGTKYSIGDTLYINVTGLLNTSTVVDDVNITNFNLIASGSIDNMNLVESTSLYNEQNLLESVNGRSVRTRTIDTWSVLKIDATELHFQKKDDPSELDSCIGIKPTSESKHDNNIRILLTGSNGYPNCYKKEEDDASI